jgi:hypothetical protein
VEGEDGEVVGIFAEQELQSFPHLHRGPAGEGEQEHLVGPGEAFFHQAGKTFQQERGLAGAVSSLDFQGALHMPNHSLTGLSICGLHMSSPPFIGNANRPSGMMAWMAAISTQPISIASLFQYVTTKWPVSR